MTTQSIDKESCWLDESSVDIAALEQLCQRTTDPDSVPLAVDVIAQIPIYEGADVRTAAATGIHSAQGARALQQEWVRVLLKGAGAVVVKNAFNDNAVVDQTTEVFYRIIERERESGRGADHFAPSGSNTRIWNAHEKLCIESPELFAYYNANDVMALMCQAWLGPGYQITAQANIVHPGGRAQQCHRDYHMGFQQTEVLYQYPAHVHALSPLLTLQGAIAHTDMPVESGPTKLLPFSQNFLPGYMATERDDCIALFESRYKQLPLAKGDMLFFNPALMHAAGDNHTTEQHRFANLVQVGTVFGRTLELLDKARMSVSLYPVLQELSKHADWNARHTQQVIEACAEGYSFPANMELEPPVNGLAPVTQQQLMSQCLHDGVNSEEFARRIAAQQAVKRSH